MQPRPSQISAPAIISIIVIVFSHIHQGVEAQATCTVTRNGGNANVMCKIPSHMDLDIVQVTWQKRTGNSYDTMVTHSRRFGVKISKPYEKRLIVLQTKDPKTSSITMSQLEKEDDACFTAIFNIYPDGSLKGEVCLQKLSDVSEVICKSTTDMRVTLDPPQIKTQHSDPSGSTIQIGRWLNDSISPVCNFQLQEARTKRSVQDDTEVFTIECNTSGRRKAKITWTEEGQPISKEEKVNMTGDLITVTSTQHHFLSTLPRGKGISCKISYNQDDEFISVQDNDHGFASLQGEDLRHEKNLNSTIIRAIIPSISLLCLIIGAVWYSLRRKRPHSPKKDDKAEKGSLSPWNSPASNHVGTPGTAVKQRKGSTGKKKKEKIQRNTQDSSYTLAHTDENNVGTPGTEVKRRKGSTGKKKKENTQDSSYTLAHTEEMKQRSEMQQSPSQKKKNSKKKLFPDERTAGTQEGEELDEIMHLQ